MYLPSLRFSSLSTGFYLACVFPPFSLRTIRLYTRVLSRTEPWLTQYCRESAIAWDHTLSLLSPYLKKKALIAGYCCDALAVPGFQMVAIAQRDVSTKNNPGRVGGRSKGTSSLSSSLFLSSSFFFRSLTLRCTPPPQRLEQATYSKRFIRVIQFIIHLNIPIVQIEWSRISPLFWMHAGGW